MKSMLGSFLFGLVGMLAACGSGPTENNGGGDGGGSDSRGDGPLPGEDECAIGEAVCTAWNTRRYCASTAQGNRYMDETCGADAGCVAGACTPGTYLLVGSSSS